MLVDAWLFAEDSVVTLRHSLLCMSSQARSGRHHHEARGPVACCWRGYARRWTGCRSTPDSNERLFEYGKLAGQLSGCSIEVCEVIIAGGAAEMAG